MNQHHGEMMTVADGTLYVPFEGMGFSSGQGARVLWRGKRNGLCWKFCFPFQDLLSTLLPALSPDPYEQHLPSFLALWLPVAISQWVVSTWDQTVGGQKGQGIYLPYSFSGGIWAGSDSSPEGHSPCWMLLSLFFFISLAFGNHFLVLPLQA